MKANELKDVIRQLVIEEVKKEVQKQLPKLLFEMLGQQSKTVVNESKPITVITNNKPISQPAPQPKKPMKRFVKDPVLNQILNETTPGLPQTPYGNSLVGFSDGNLNKIEVSDEFVGEVREILNEGTSASDNTNIQETQNGPDLSKLFNKNFKAILNKSKERGANGGNFSGIIQNW